METISQGSQKLEKLGKEGSKFRPELGQAGCLEIGRNSVIGKAQSLSQGFSNQIKSRIKLQRNISQNSAIKAPKITVGGRPGVRAVIELRNKADNQLYEVLSDYRILGRNDEKNLPEIENYVISVNEKREMRSKEIRAKRINENFEKKLRKIFRKKLSQKN